MPISKLSGSQVADSTLANRHLAANAEIATSKLAEGLLFLKADGSIALTSPLSGVLPSLPAHFTTKDYVDSLTEAAMQAVPWQNVTGVPHILPDLSMSVQVPAMSGTSIIPMDNTTPGSNEGTQIASITCTPSSPDSKLAIKGALAVDCGTSNRNLVIAAFRNGVCFGAVPMNFVSAGRPNVFPFSFVDLTAGANYGGSSITYSLRFGAATACTWYVNRLASQVLNGMMARNNIIFWEYI